MNRRLKILAISVVLITIYSYFAGGHGIGPVKVLPLGATGTLKAIVRQLARIAIVGAIVALYYLGKRIWRTPPTLRLPARSQNIEQAVLLHIPFSEGKDSLTSEQLFALEDKLTAILKQSGAGALDGNEIGDVFFTLFLYGTDADELLAAITPVLQTFKAPIDAFVILRYGPPGATERRISFSNLSMSALN